MDGSEHFPQELDLSYLDILRTTQELHEKKSQLQVLLAEGYLCMSKARYAVGTGRISKLHYAPNMNPGFEVNVDLDSDIAKFEVVNVANRKIDNPQSKGQSNIKFRLAKHEDESGGLSDPQVENLASNLSNLVVKDNHDSESDEPSNPLKWFGVLVPEALRQSQKRFQQSLTLVGEICSLQSKLLSIEKKHLHLVKESK